MVVAELLHKCYCNDYEINTKVHLFNQTITLNHVSVTPIQLEQEHPDG